MSGGWLVAVYVLFPIPLILLTLLSIPMPSALQTRVRSGILKVTDSVLFFKLGGGVTVYTVLTAVSLLLFLLTSYETMRYTEKLARSLGEKEERSSRALKWRSERNFWISFFSLTLWLLLYRMRSLMVELNSIRLTLKRMD